MAGARSLGLGDVSAPGASVTSNRPGPPLPNMLLLGAQKCGTTALANSLRRHPEIFLPARKELHHFGEVPDDRAAGDAYRTLFAGWEGERWLGEATPAYLYLASAARQIGKHLPGVMALAVLRNPVDRAYSAYWHGRRLYRFSGTFEEALADEPRRLAEGAWGFAALVDRGRYATQLQRYADSGVARDRLLVVLHEDLVGDQVTTLAGIARFLGLASALDPLERRNESARQVLPAFVGRRLQNRAGRQPLAARIVRAGRRPFRYPPMDPVTRRVLVDTFAPGNAALAEWLGRDLSHWNR